MAVYLQDFLRSYFSSWMFLPHNKLFSNISYMDFSGLNLSKQLAKAISELGYTKATTIQEKAFSPAMSGRDLVGIAQTGTGKTLAYLLPCLMQYRFSKEPHPQIAILVPTRELVAQVVKEAEKLCPYINIRIQGVYGGANINTQNDRITEGVDLIVGTPGRFRDLVLMGGLKLKNIKKLVIDEIDEMLDLGFREQLIRLLELFPEKRQNLMFSATITDDVSCIIDDFFVSPIRIEAAPAGAPLDCIEQNIYAASNFKTKLNLLVNLIADHQKFSKVLVFAMHRRMADAIHASLEPILGEGVRAVHSNKSQNYRFNSVRYFHAGDIRVLVATDLISRGIDIEDVSHVINFDFPDDPETYVHRIGRTGRADKTGSAISFATENDAATIEAAEKLMGKEIPRLELPSGVEISEELEEFEKPGQLQLGTVPRAPKQPEAAPIYKQPRKKKKPLIKKFARQIKEGKGTSKKKKRDRF
jgi:ATP-dependent RNA helicase RhlE